MKTYTDQEMRQIIIERYTKPRHFGLTNAPSLNHLDLDSPTCSDKLQLEFRIVDGKIQDLRFGGTACAIATATTDILIDELTNQPLSEVGKILKNYNNFIHHRNDVDFESLNQLVVFKNIYKQKGRIKCATLTSDGFQHFLLDLH